MSAMKILPKLLFFSGVVLFLAIGINGFLLGPNLAGPGLGPNGTAPDLLDPKLIMQIVISLALLLATLLVILSKSYGPKDKHWAYSTLGLVVGFWLKP